MKQPKPYKRKLLNLKVNGRMQLVMIVKISFILFICLFITSLTYYYFANQEITASFRMFHIKARNFLDILMPSVIGSFIVSLVLGVLASLFFPKNYAGGLYGMERDIRKVINGNLSARVKLREGDAAVPLAETVNELINCFTDKIIHLENFLATAEQTFNETNIPPEERLNKIKKIHHRLLEDIKK